MQYEYISNYENHSEQAEQAVLGAILKNSSRVLDATEVLTSDDFYQPQHRVLFSAIEYHVEANQPIDVVTLSTYLTSLNQLEACGGLGYMAELAHNTPSSANLSAYVQTVYLKRKERDVLCMASEMVCEIHADCGTSEERINNALALTINIEEKETLQTYGEMNKGFLDALAMRHKLGGEITGLSTGFKDIDARLNGLQKTDLIIVAGRPGSGKTTYAMNIAKVVSETKPTLVFSMEMSGEQLIERMYSSDGILMNSLKRGTLDDAEWTTVNKVGQKAAKRSILIDDRGALKPQQVRARALKYKRKYGDIGVIVIDYIQLMTVNKSQGQTDKVTQISGSLKALAKEMNCSVIALSQLSRDCEKRPNKRPVLSDLRDSGAIEQDADIIQFIYRDDYYANLEGRESTNPHVAEINTAKFRGGEVGVDMMKEELHYSRFVDIPDGYEPPVIESKKKSRKF